MVTVKRHDDTIDQIVAEPLSTSCGATSTAAKAQNERTKLRKDVAAGSAMTYPALIIRTR
jgi:hypothetical protein